jgi:hypothetical protein
LSRVILIYQRARVAENNWPIKLLQYFILSSESNRQGLNHGHHNSSIKKNTGSSANHG